LSRIERSGRDIPASQTSGFLVKDMALDDILAAIRVAAAGNALIAPGVTQRLISRFASMPSSAPQPPACERPASPGASSAPSPNANAKC
jgi:DNA-binding NarL/FixJ family response regulator